MKKHEHIFIEYKDPHGSILNFCEICGYNKELGFIDERTIKKDAK